MKILYIVRHAKSSWDDFSVTDHDRKLLSTGIARTRKVAAWLRQKNILPEKIITSTAVRAVETALILAEEMGFPVESIEKNKTLYGAFPEDVMPVLFSLPDTITSVMMVGHNPGWTEWVNMYAEINKQIDNFLTSAVASVRFAVDKWNEISMVHGELDFVITPKNLK